MAREPKDWMPLDVRKYLGDTMNLTRDQHGAYLLLIMAYWMRGCALNDNDNELAAIVRANRKEWKELRPVMEQYFVIEGGKWIQQKAEKELARAREIMEAKSEAGRKGAENRWQTNGKGNGKPVAEASVSHKQNDAPIPIPIPISEAKASSIELPDWLPQEPWFAFLDGRRRQKIPNTVRSLKLVLTKLDDFRAKGHDPGKLLDTAIERGWRTVFEPNERQGNGQAGKPKQTAHDKFLAGTLAAIDSDDADAGSGFGVAGDGRRDAGEAGYPLLPARLHGGSG